MPEFLTKRKARWANTVQPKTLRGKPLNYNAAAMQRYHARLAKLVDRMTAGTEKELRALFEEPHAEVYFAEDATVSAQAKILMNALKSKFQDLFDLNARPIADATINDADTSSAVALRSSLKDLSGGLTLNTSFLTAQLKNIRAASITENVSLIKSIASEYLSGVEGALMRSITTGNGLADLIPYLLQNKDITAKRAQTIAFDQTRKAFNVINNARMKKIGVKQFEWLHSGGGQHPRRLHQQMSGNIYSLDSPPVIQESKGKTPEVRGIPGQLINCRCRMMPVIDFGEA